MKRHSVSKLSYNSTYCNKKDLSSLTIKIAFLWTPIVLTHPVAMNASPTCYGLRLVDLFVMCRAILVHLSAGHE